MTFSTLFHAAPQDLEVNSATFYFNKSVVINNTIRYVSKLNTKIFHSNKIADESGLIRGSLVRVQPEELKSGEFTSAFCILPYVLHLHHLFQIS